MTTSELPQGAAQNVISLLLGHPDPATLLTPEFQDALQSVVGAPKSYTALQYGPEQGAPSLIHVLIERLNREQGLTLEPHNMMLVAGSTHAVDMIGRLYAKPGGVVLVEAPTYADSIHVFRDHQIELCPIPMDEHGLVVSELESRVALLASFGKTPRLLYTIPNFHNPTGITLPAERRKQIIEVARQYGFMIVEDDVYRDLAFEGTPPASFYALSGGANVLSIGSFSKTLAPGLRLGWLVGPPELIQKFVNCGTTQMGGGANPFTSRIVSEYIRRGHWDGHVTGLRALYKSRCDVALSALSQSMPPGVTWTHPAGGFFIWLTLPAGLSAQEIKRVARQRGLMVAAGTGFFVNPDEGDHYLRLAYSFSPPDDIRRGIGILGAVIGEMLTN